MPVLPASMPFLMVHLYSFAFPNKSICAVWYEAGVCQTTANVWCVVRVCLYAYSVQYTIILIIIIWDFCQFCQCRSCSNQTTAHWRGKIDVYHHEQVHPPGTQQDARRPFVQTRPTGHSAAHECFPCLFPTVLLLVSRVLG